MITRGTLLVCTLATGLILGAGYWLGTTSSRSPDPTPLENLAEPPTEPPAPVDPPTPDPQVTSAPAPAQGSSPEQPQTQIAEASRSETALTSSAPAPSPYTRGLVGSLTGIDLKQGPITPEQAEQWKVGRQALVAQGAAAVPAIREFLLQNQDAQLTAANGGSLLGETSMRLSMIEALRQIGGPEATAAMLETLQNSSAPSELARLAQNLEQVAPGQYRQELVSAANAALAAAAKTQGDGDVGALFQMLQTYGDAGTASALEQLQSQWSYYAMIGLAGLPEGQGIPSLVRQAEDPAAGGKQSLALQLLAQVSGQYPEAGNALLEQARLNQIPDRAWTTLASALAGDQYHIGAAPSGPDGTAIPGLMAIHMAAGNQNFYSLPVTDPSELQKRLALIDQLLAASQNPAAIAALQNARTRVSEVASR